MTVSWYYIFFLVMVIILCTIIMSKQYDYKPKNKNIQLLTDISIYFIFGLSVSFLFFNGDIKWWTVLLSLPISAILTLCLAVVLNRSANLYDDSPKYTTDDLIGKYGMVSSQHGHAQYLGKLADENETDIVVTIYEPCKPGDMFVITEINEEGIIAKVKQK